MPKEKELKNNTEIERPPVVVIMGHVDHGKSKLLDYIRKTNIVDKEAGGITQKISAYEIIHKDEKEALKKITFLDTPGHEAFSKIRSRGADVADIAILVVSAEDGVKAQTIEAYKTIEEAKIPLIIAINKIDRPEANIEKTKIDLVENTIYIEGYGGKIPCVEISAKTGQNVDNLLEMILIVAEMENLKANPNKNATGIIIESDLDPKRGISASLIIKDGTLKKGDFVVVENVISGTRIFENFLGDTIEEATFSSPVKVTGFNKMPNVGSTFESYNDKKSAERASTECKLSTKELVRGCIGFPFGEGTKIIPIIIKADLVGSLDALEKELGKLNTEEISFKIIGKGVGIINESDIKTALSDENSLIVGFNVKIEKSANELYEKSKILVKTFNIIYELVNWVKEIQEARRPRKEIAETTGKAKIQKTFSQTKNKQIIGGKVLEGKLTACGRIRIIRNDHEIGCGIIKGLEQNKAKIKEVEEGQEFGMLADSSLEIAPGDIIESFTMTTV